ncbi:uncharacterized protein A1O9_12760 [Exophiala aquamarina CBS 119918]|uniref:Uncharacterized protein n=1 Tax=Exophiala aquamarina CBS 119918 TaxID=1182545 RepID=A0A072NU33_9EURO|nr:uncharacterized protein A1O9_12760 [Exophiala aquamarina CBS 119918]KEF51146.1 hypothetical protein A1O9_12760 [Exophiala aquamarina CBS 119918]
MQKPQRLRFGNLRQSPEDFDRSESEKFKDPVLLPGLHEPQEGAISHLRWLSHPYTANTIHDLCLRPIQRAKHLGFMSTLACHRNPQIMPDQGISRPTLDISGALCSHIPLYFAALPAARSEMTPAAASRLLYISSWKLHSETSQEEPKLRKLLGHISIYDKTRKFPHTASDSSKEGPDTKTPPYLAYQVPSFKAFQAAIQDQLANLAKIAPASTLSGTDLSEIGQEEEEEEDDDDDGSDYDSYDGDEWTDEDTSADSDESFTDTESLEGPWSECTSPTEACSDEEEHSDQWAIRPVPITIQPLAS